MAGKEIVKGTFGNESIELNNAATEATLTELLKLARKDSVTLTEMAKKAGVDTKKIQDSLNKSQAGSGGAPEKASAGMGILGGAAKMAGGLLADLGGSVMQTAGNLFNFGTQLLDGAGKASDLAAAFKDLPLGIGLFAQAMAFSTKYFEKNFEAFQAMSGSGAGLVGSFNTLKIDATRLGLDLQQYGAMYSKNADIMVRLGGSMSQGSKNLLNMNQSFMNSDMGKNLYRLGFSFEQLADLIPSYIRTTGDSIDINKDYNQEVSRIQKSSAQYGQDLDFLARMTGISREEQQKKMQDIMGEASFQMWLLKQPKEQQETIREMLSREMVTGGKGAVDLMKAKLTNFAGAFSKEGQTYGASMGEGTRIMDQMITVMKSSLSPEEKRTKLNELMARQTTAQIRDLDNNSTAIMAMGRGAEGGARSLLELTELSNKYRSGENGRALTTKEIMKLQQDAIDQAKKDADQVKKQQEQDYTMKKLSASLQSSLLGIMVKLNDITQKLVGKFSDLVNKHIGDFTSAIEKVVSFINQAIEDPAGAWNKISGWFKGMLAKMLETFSTSWLGKKLFGDAAESLGRQARIESMRGIDETRYNELEQLKKRTVEQEAEYQALRKQKREGELALAVEMREKAKGFTDEAKIKQAAIDRLSQTDAYKGMGVGQLTNIIENANNRNGGLAASAALKPLIEQITKEQENKQRQFNRDALQVELGNKSLKDLKGPLSNVPEFADGTVGSGKGILQNFGKESLAKLHGKEAVLTEEQLTNLAKGIQQGSGTMVVGGSEILAEHLITLNRQAAMQNRILTQIVENQRTMLNRTNGNRLMA